MIVTEQIWADEYTDMVMRKHILSEYNKKYRPVPSPFTHPENYDPLNPPTGYRYDPYYECWVNTAI